MLVIYNKGFRTGEDQ